MSPNLCRRGIRRYAALILVYSLQAAAAAPTTERQNKLLQLLKHDCGACHGLTLKGGLGPALLAETLQNKNNALLAATILEGRKGTAMPPWKDFLSENEVIWIINYLRKQ